LCINAENPKSGLIKSGKTVEESIELFNYLLLKESWQTVVLDSEVNAKCNVFMGMILYYFNIEFPKI
jgi:hypothetical protein